MGRFRKKFKKFAKKAFNPVKHVKFAVKSTKKVGKVVKKSGLGKVIRTAGDSISGGNFSRALGVAKGAASVVNRIKPGNSQERKAVNAMRSTGADAPLSASGSMFGGGIGGRLGRMRGGGATSPALGANSSALRAPVGIKSLWQKFLALFGVGV